MNPAEVAFAPEARPLIIHALHWIATAIELVGVGVIVAGAVVATALLARRAAIEGWAAAFQQYRANLGRGILLGLEFLIAADIIGTVAATPTFYSLGILGLIIGIRTLLSFSLEVEIEGRWPWHRQSSGEIRR
jgi:uncharacterized membrane protein